jgi:hypothetical protein
MPHFSLRSKFAAASPPRRAPCSIPNAHATVAVRAGLHLTFGKLNATAVIQSVCFFILCCISLFLVAKIVTNRLGNQHGTPLNTRLRRCQCARLLLRIADDFNRTLLLPCLKRLLPPLG